jgi:Ca2+-binding EF-hand superfamily protein
LTFEDVLQLLDEPWTVINNDRETLREALEKFDEKKEGYIDIDRFRTAMSTLGEPLSDEDVDALIQLGVNDEQTKINIDRKIYHSFFSIRISMIFLEIVDQLLGISA